MERVPRQSFEDLPEVVFRNEAGFLLCRVDELTGEYDPDGAEAQYLCGPLRVERVAALRNKFEGEKAEHEFAAFVTKIAIDEFTEYAAEALLAFHTFASGQEVDYSDCITQRDITLLISLCEIKLKMYNPLAYQDYDFKEEAKAAWDEERRFDDTVVIHTRSTTEE